MVTSLWVKTASHFDPDVKLYDDQDRSITHSHLFVQTLWALIIFNQRLYK